MLGWCTAMRQPNTANTSWQKGELAVSEKHQPKFSRVWGEGREEARKVRRKWEGGIPGKMVGRGVLRQRAGRGREESRRLCHGLTFCQILSLLSGQVEIVHCHSSLFRHALPLEASQVWVDLYGTHAALPGKGNKLPLSKVAQPACYIASQECTVSDPDLGSTLKKIHLKSCQPWSNHIIKVLL